MTAPLIIGHRGASGYRPEHTEAAYRLAFEQGADAVEPDLVPSRDGVLVARHENDITTTTDVVAHPEFAARRTTKTIEGRSVTGWFTEDFDWVELRTLRARERRPELRPDNARYDDAFPLLRLGEVLALAAEAPTGRPHGVVAELKHAAHFAALGYPMDELLARELRESGHAEALWATESADPKLLSALRRARLPGTLIGLLEEAQGDGTETWDRATPLRSRVDALSVEKRVLLDPSGPTLVNAAHDAGLTVYAWTLRPENRYLEPRFRGPGGEAEHGHWRKEWRELFSRGVDAVFADHPDLALRVRAEA